MATVYLAEDLKHHRMVAVKVMRPELSATLGSERFLREVEIAARLSHPHILPVFDSGEADGFLYYVMPFVAGESLPGRLAREKQLAAPEALRLAREVAEALAHAHAEGIVHRDIKPANILISAGHALVADFGIARAAAARGEALTQTGLAIGTPQYMSPEQAGGGSDVDGRTDIYALGCVLYEMLAGEPPFTGPTAHMVISRAISEPPRPVERSRDGLAPATIDVVNRSLAKAPADRFSDASAMAAALALAEDQTRSGVRGATPPRRWNHWARAAAVALAVAVVAVIGFGLGRSGPSATSGVRRLAILPFENQGGPDDAYFADGIVDEVRGKLARLGRISVIASTSANQYRGSDKPPTEIARELGVDYLLVGKVRWVSPPGSDRRVQVVSELINGSTGATDWQETFDANVTDVLEMQGTMASRVAGALGTALGTTDQATLAAKPTDNAAAYDLYLRGRAILDNGATQQRQAASYFEQAVALDTTFADAWARLATAMARVYGNGNRDPAAARRAGEAVDRALALAPNHALSHVASGQYQSLIRQDLAAAGREFDRAIALDSTSVEALSGAANHDVSVGHPDSALIKLRRARELDPRSDEVLASILTSLVQLGEFDEAKRVGQDVLALSPGNLQSVQLVVDAYLGTDDLPSAQRVLTEAMSRVPVTQVVTYFAGYNEMAWLFDGDRRDVLFRLTPTAFDNDVAWWGQALAIAAYQQGDTARARTYADSSLAVAAEQAATSPSDLQLGSLYAVMLAYHGDRAAARAEVDRVGRLAATSPNRSATWGYAMVQLARAEIGLGNLDRAAAALEVAWRAGGISAGRLRLDPSFAILKGNPTFARIVAR